ncbi:hypothetical protein [Burkholderia sp. RF2-non_BP3]|uniref:hypothetical protein n=1 Tax=Burkholderia sp. RF2-non_BP3 TaxID=1637844 RepID=UPI0007558708|nr:hypothetical protein [Burkholderia sp. RF2-non_BP3]KUY49060.1 hypothetical protein WS45_03590 [Burkholderia sp. RF2-non_BP3]
MKLTSTSTQQALYRDIFDVTANEIDRIAIGAPVRVCLQANPSGSDGSLSEPRQDASTTPCAARTAVRILD